MYVIYKSRGRGTVQCIVIVMFDHFEQCWLHVNYLEEIVMESIVYIHVAGRPARKKYDGMIY